MSTFKTIHIFGFGDAQVIGTDKKGTVKANTLTKLTALINNIKSLKPVDIVAADYHVIHIFNGTDIKYLGKPEVKTDKASFTVKITDVDQTMLNEFVTELEAAV